MRKEAVLETEILPRIKKLPFDKIKEILDYIDFLRWQETKKEKEIIEFDEWAVNLAKKKGFSQLTQKDINRIVHECRK